MRNNSCGDGHSSQWNNEMVKGKTMKENWNRRDFLTGTAWMLGAAAVSGCAIDKPALGGGGMGSMCNFRP